MGSCWTAKSQKKESISITKRLSESTQILEVDQHQLFIGNTMAKKSSTTVNESLLNTMRVIIFMVLKAGQESLSRTQPGKIGVTTKLLPRIQLVLNTCLFR